MRVHYPVGCGWKQSTVSDDMSISLKVGLKTLQYVKDTKWNNGEKGVTSFKDKLLCYGYIENTKQHQRIHLNKSHWLTTVSNPLWHRSSALEECSISI